MLVVGVVGMLKPEHPPVAGYLRKGDTPSRVVIHEGVFAYTGAIRLVCLVVTKVKECPQL